MSEDRLSEFQLPSTAVDSPIEVNHPLVMPPGVYFGLDEQRYHAALALSASGIKWLRVSPLDWWVRSPLNPEPPDESVEDSAAKRIGKSYHTRILEGREKFYRLYAPAIDPNDYPDSIRTVEELKSALDARRLTYKSTTRKPDLITQLVSIDPDAVIWDRVVAQHAEQHAGKMLLDHDLIKRIEISAAMIERHPQLGKAFSGGYPEVSVFWVDQRTGVPCKARIDFLKPRVITDLKSFDHQGRPIDKAIARAVAMYKYHIQTRHYLDAGIQIRRFIREGLVYGCEDAAFLKAVAEAQDQTFLFVWQAKGMAPIARGKILGDGSVLDIARMEIDDAKLLWARSWQTFGDAPWVDVSEIETFDDLMFPAYLSD